MRLFARNHGAVSVFLVIVLVPILIVTSLFVDVSRVHMGQAMVDSAGDLALNTALTEFDEKLNDYYGLLGTCKTSEELKKVSEDFYKTSLVSAGLTGEDADNIAATLMSMFDEDPGDISDLMNLQLVDNSFDVKKIGNSGFNNPAVVKTQVVNFMKYRSPMNAVSEIFDMFSTISQKADEVDDETDLVGKRQKFAESEADLLKQLKDLADNILDYEKCGVDYGAGYQKIASASGMKTIIEYVDSGYEKDFYSYAEEAAINFLFLDISDLENYNPKANKVKEAESKKGNPSLTPTFEEMDKNILDYIKKRDALKAACEAESTGNALRDKLVKAIKVPEAYKEYKKAAEDMSQTYKNMIDAFSAISNKDDPCAKTFESLNNKSLTNEETYDAFKGAYEHHRKDFTGGNTNSAYYKIQHDQVAGVGTANLNQLKNEYNTEKGKIDNKLATQSDKATKIGSGLEAAKEALELAITNLQIIKGEKKADGADAAKDLVKEFLNAETSWSGKIDSTSGMTDSNIRKQDVDLKETEKELIDGVRSKMTTQNINRLLAHLQKIKGEIVKLQNKIISMKLGNTMIADLRTVESVNDILETAIDQDTFEKNIANTQKLKEMIRTAYDSKYKENNTNLSVDWVSNANYKPDLAGDPIYDWLFSAYMKKKFEKPENVKEEDKKKYDDYKKVSKDKSKDAEKKDGVKPSASMIPSQYYPSTKSIKKMGTAELPSKNVAKDPENKSSDDLQKSANLINTMFAGMGNAMKDVRDDLYVIDYITSMLSYDTYVNEGLYEVAKEKNLKVDELATIASSLYNPEVVKEWTDEDLTNRANKTLTNKEISKTNNYAFGAEAEYILYGMDSSAKNIATAYATIFAVRLGFNSIYGFSEFWNDGKIVALATTISAATYGVIPESLIRIAIILGLVVAESANDLLMLKAGMPVALLKSDSTWEMSMQAVFNDADLNGASGVNANHETLDNFNELQYSDYIKIFLLVKMIGDSGENKVYLRLADVIQCNMAHITENNNYSMTKCKTWVTVSSKVRVNPLMLDLPWTRDAQGNPKDDTRWYTLTYQRSNGYY